MEMNEKTNYILYNEYSIFDVFQFDMFMYIHVWKYICVQYFTKNLINSCEVFCNQVYLITVFAVILNNCNTHS